MNPGPRAPFAWLSSPCGPALQSQLLSGAAFHVFTSRHLPLRGDAEREGWTRLAQLAGVSPRRLVRLHQVHGTAAVLIRRDSPFVAVSDDQEVAGYPHADMSMTDDPAVALVVKTADCVPLLIADPSHGAVAAVHAGWRGTAAGIAGSAVMMMARAFDSRPEDLIAAIGPSIGACCYQVGADVFEAFRDRGWTGHQLQQWFRADLEVGRFRLDVAVSNRDQLILAGVRAAQVGLCDLCTSCHPEMFHSYRRDAAAAGRMAAVIRPMAPPERHAVAPHP